MSTKLDPAPLVDELMQVAVALIERGVKPQRLRAGGPVSVWLHPDLDERIDSIVHQLVGVNPQMLSVHQTGSTLKSLVLTAVVDSHARGGVCHDYLRVNQGEELPVRDFVAGWIEHYASYSDVTTLEAFVLHFPVSRSFSWGAVRFDPVNPWEGRGDVLVDGLIDGAGARIAAVARFDSEGDGVRRFDHFNQEVNRALRMLVGAAWPQVSAKPFLLPSVVGTGPGTLPAPYREIRDGQRGGWGPLLTRRGHPAVTFPDVVEDCWGALAERLFLMAHSPSGPMQERVREALGWLGEAGGDERPSMRLVRVATALEAMVSDGSAGVVATLRERAAFLAAEDAADRLAIDGAVANYYGRRSRVVHGRISTKDVTEEDVIEFGQIAWAVAQGIVRRFDDLVSADDLRDWVQAQRYR